MAKAEVSKSSGLTALPRYFHDSWIELKKVHKPTRQETVQATIVVLVMVIAVAIFLGTIDLFLGWFMKWATEQAFN